MSDNSKSGSGKEGKNLLFYCKNAALKLQGKAVDEFEIYGLASISNLIEIYNLNVENLSFSDTKGLGFRIFKDGRMGYAYTSNLEETEIEKCIEKAVDNSIITNKEQYNYLPQEEEFKYKKGLVDEKDLFSEKFMECSIEDKIKIAKQLEIITRKKDKRVKGISNLLYEDNLTDVNVINSAGFNGSYKTSSAFIYESVISREGSDNSTGDYFGYARDPEKLDTEMVAENAVKRSVMLLGAKKVKSQMGSVLLDPFVAAQFIGVIAGILAADTVQKGKSLFKGRIGEKIFNGDFNIIDDGTLKEGLSSKPFDGEGVPKGRTVIFDRGVLKTYLYNTFTARKNKTLSTGNAVRSSYKSPPAVGISNFYIEPSTTSFDNLIKRMDKGFYVMDIIGLHSGVNPISGHISVGAKGLWIEEGSISYPLKEVTIATDILSFCKNLEKIGSDIKYMPAGGYIGSPSMLIRNITISGN